MNAIMALLTAASVLAHAALGCCIHHSHDPFESHRASAAASPGEQREHRACGHCRGHDQDLHHDDRLPDAPREQCDERDCVAVAGTAPTALLKSADTAFISMPLGELLAIAAGSALYVQSAGLEHDLGPPVRPHLFHRVLLI